MTGALALHPGAVEHYEDAEAYERRYDAREEDVAYYLKRCRGVERVLEVGAGAGRLTLPLLKRGLSVTAVDSSEPMLKLLAKRAESLPLAIQKRLTTHCADMRTFRARKRYDRVIAAFHTVCHLYALSDIRAFLELAHFHLVPGGRLEFDLPLPRIDVSEYDPISQVRMMEFDGLEGTQLLTQRWYHPQEIAMHLAYTGFCRVRLRADFTSEMIQPETSVFTVSAEVPK
jgi:SAM-dependent methyltransferase